MFVGMCLEKMLFSIKHSKKGENSRENHLAACSRPFLTLSHESFIAPEIPRS